VFERVLIPVELGEFDELVLGFVRGISRYGVRSVVLLHCAATTGMEQAVARRREIGAREALSKLAEPLRAAGLDTTESICGGGSPDEATLKAADQERVTLIVTGTRSKTALGELTVGSTSEEIGRRAKVPVLMVPFKSLDGNTGEDAEKTGSELLDQVVFATDFSDVSERCLDTLVALDSELIGTVHVTHVTNAPEDRAEDGISLRGVERMIEGMATELRGKGISADVDIIRGTPPVQGVLGAADSAKATCIALGSHGRGIGEDLLLGSVSQDVIRGSSLPLLVTH